MLPNLSAKLKVLVRGLLTLAILLLLSSFSSPTSATCGDIIHCNQEIDRVKKEISRLQGLEDNLQNQIAYLDNQIYLSQLEIQAKEDEINVLSGDINDLSVRLSRISSFLGYQEKIFATRAKLAYTSDQLSPFDVVLGAETLDDALRRIKYLHVLEDQDIQVLNQMHDTRTSFNEQKKSLEDKKTQVEQLKAEVEDQKKSLIGKQNAKQDLLVITNGQESNYQKYLKQLESERNAILAALRKGGKKLGTVTRGEKIWPQGSTGCSTGAHIHYEVRVSSTNSVLNPCNGFVGCHGLGNSVTSNAYYTPGGPSNRLTQGYGGGHLALDLVSGDGWVHASENGTAYLVEDKTWKSWCWVNKPYDGPAYGIYIIHSDGHKTVYWHIQKP